MIFQSIRLRRSVTLVGITVLALLFMTEATVAQTVHVDAKASGYFGAFSGTVDEASVDLVEAHVFSKPGVISITVEGTIVAHPDYAKFKAVGPNGLSFKRSRSGCYSPLEEKLVDARGYGALTPISERGGALFGAFVPQSIVDKPGFRSINNDFPNGRISSDELFFVGERLDYSARQPGTLFLGVNDCRPYNNSGAFSVRIEER